MENVESIVEGISETVRFDVQFSNGLSIDYTAPLETIYKIRAAMDNGETFSITGANGRTVILNTHNIAWITYQ